MPSPKVCIFTETYYPVVGGGETQAQLLAENLVAEGFPVIILTRRSDKSLKKVERYGEITVFRLPPTGGGQLKKWGLVLSSIPALLRLRGRYDLIFVSGYRIVGITAVLLAKLLGKKVVLKADSQGEMSGEFFRNGLARLKMSPDRFPFKAYLALRNRLLKRADAFAAISQELAEEMTAVGVAPKIIFQIPNSVDTKRFYPVEPHTKADFRRQLDLPPSGTIAVFTGRLVSYKGLPLLLTVWKSLYAAYPEISLLLLGTGGQDIHNCEAELRAYVEANGLQETIRFTGAVQNVPDYLQAADLFVFPTEDDALPSSLLEAMACRLPVVTTPVGAIKSIIVDRRNGLSVQPGNFQQLYDALELVMNSPELAARLGMAGRHTVLEHYSAEIVTRKYMALFKQLTQHSIDTNSQKMIRSSEKNRSVIAEKNE